MLRSLSITLTAALAAAFVSGCNNSSGSGDQAPGANTFGEGELPQRFGVYMESGGDIAGDLTAFGDLPYFVDLATGEARALATNLPITETTQIRSQVLSPDGRILALSILDGSSAHHHLVATADGRSLRLPYDADLSEDGGSEDGNGYGGSAGSFLFSPDSKFILFRSNNFNNRGVWLLNSNGTNSQSIEINGEVPFNVVWIPGTRSFISVGENATDTGSIIRVTNADTLQSTDNGLLPSGDLYVDKAVLSKDGSKLAIAYCIEPCNFVQVGCLDLGTGVFTEFDTGTEDAYDRTLVISDDGSMVAFAVIDSATNNDSRVYMGRTSDGMVVRVDPATTQTEPNAENLAFEPGGNRLAFVGDFASEEAYDLFLASFDSPTVNVTSFVEDGYVDEYEWSPSNGGPARYLGLVTDSISTDFMIVDADSPQTPFVPTVPGIYNSAQHVGFSGDGNWMLMEIRGPGYDRLFRACHVEQDGSGGTDLGTCERGTLANSSSSEYGSLNDGAFDALAVFPGERTIVWTRSTSAGESDEIVVGDPMNAAASQVLPTLAEPGTSTAIRSIATRTLPSVGGGPK